MIKKNVNSRAKILLHQWLPNTGSLFAPLYVYLPRSTCSTFILQNLSTFLLLLFNLMKLVLFVYLLDCFIWGTLACSFMEAWKMQRGLPVTQASVTMAVVLFQQCWISPSVVCRSFLPIRPAWALPHQGRCWVWSQAELKLFQERLKGGRSVDATFGSLNTVWRFWCCGKGRAVCLNC